MVTIGVQVFRLTGSALKVLGVPQASKDAESPLPWSVLFWVNGVGLVGWCCIGWVRDQIHYVVSHNMCWAWLLCGEKMVSIGIYLMNPLAAFFT